MLSLPAADEFGGHFGTYIALVADRDVLGQLEENRRDTTALFAALTDEQANFRYAPDKWSLKELLGHLADTERVMSYRMLRIARGDTTPLPGFDQDSYIANADFSGVSMPQLLADYEAVRAATLSLTRSIAPEAWLRKGTASNATMSARAFAYVIAGHELHHLNIVRDRYLRA
ncbi:DinB family protein [Paenibacillus lycopersici]|uniref:DinB family protein n=1 Tax=Paenibacillus lycopersici TaxID=2704462 RepID=A0A6C0FVJ9_9BACL|nr:DinB family protein [Paenibacillus lycopersici]QHT59491.1 DinB family protein [Paenibacillus lycopersici]